MSLNGKTVLFAWELGEGLGHLPALKAIATALKAEGARPIFALRNPIQTRAALAEINAPILPAPFWPSPALPPVASGTYADILVGNGFGSAADLRALLASWTEIFELSKPDLVVCEHAPGAALTAFGRVPVAFVGNGFVVPPADGAEFPAYEPGKGEPGRQQPVLEIIREALHATNRALPKTICEPFRGAFRGIYSFPELDTYRGVRREAVLGPIEPVPECRPLPAARRLFVYSNADYEQINEVTRALMESAREASAYFRGRFGARANVLSSRGVTFYETAPALSKVLPEASVVFSHGGTGFSNAALAAGRPHIVTPRHFEAYRTARCLEQLGAGVIFAPFEAKSFRDAVRRANEDQKMREAAQRAGEAAQTFMKAATPLATTIEALRKILS